MILSMKTHQVTPAMHEVCCQQISCELVVTSEQLKGLDST